MTVVQSCDSAFAGHADRFGVCFACEFHRLKKLLALIADFDEVNVQPDNRTPVDGRCITTHNNHIGAQLKPFRRLSNKHPNGGWSKPLSAQAGKGLCAQFAAPAQMSSVAEAVVSAPSQRRLFR